MASDAKRAFIQDLRRCAILGPCLPHWGLPDQRSISRKGHHQLEVYTFPPEEKAGVRRFITMGISGFQPAKGAPPGYELLLAISGTLSGATYEQTADFLLDVAIGSLKWKPYPEDGLKLASVDAVMPKAWKPRGILFLQPLAEPEELSSFHFGPQHIDLLWVLPIYSQEADYIDRHGLDAFHKLIQQPDADLVDFQRPPVVRG